MVTSLAWNNSLVESGLTRIHEGSWGVSCFTAHSTWVCWPLGSMHWPLVDVHFDTWVRVSDHSLSVPSVECNVFDLHPWGHAALSGSSEEFPETTCRCQDGSDSGSTQTHISPRSYCSWNTERPSLGPTSPETLNVRPSVLLLVKHWTSVPPLNVRPSVLLLVKHWMSVPRS